VSAFFLPFFVPPCYSSNSEFSDLAFMLGVHSESEGSNPLAVLNHF